MHVTAASAATTLRQHTCPVGRTFCIRTLATSGTAAGSCACRFSLNIIRITLATENGFNANYIAICLRRSYGRPPLAKVLYTMRLGKLMRSCRPCSEVILKDEALHTYCELAEKAKQPAGETEVRNVK